MKLNSRLCCSRYLEHFRHICVELQRDTIRRHSLSVSDALSWSRRTTSWSKISASLAISGTERARYSINCYRILDASTSKCLNIDFHSHIISVSQTKLGRANVDFSSCRYTPTSTWRIIINDFSTMRFVPMIIATSTMIAAIFAILPLKI